MDLAANGVPVSPRLPAPAASYWGREESVAGRGEQGQESPIKIGGGALHTSNWSATIPAGVKAQGMNLSVCTPWLQPPALRLSFVLATLPFQ